MLCQVEKCLRNTFLLLKPSISSAFLHASSEMSPPASSSKTSMCISRVGVQHYVDSAAKSDIEILVAKARNGSSDAEVLQSLVHDQSCSAIHVTQDLVHKLLHRLKDDWKSALAVFRWAESRPGYKHTSEACDMVVDVLGKAKKMDQMKSIMEEMRRSNLVSLNTVGKVMRRFAGAGQWEDAVRTFDELGNFGLKKNTESMNLLLDTLCKEYRVEQARAVFLELKSYIAPDAHTFNIFIHGWCKANRVDEAHWTIQEMKGHGCRPCVISYSTIIQFYCQQTDFKHVYELFDEMQAQGCPPNTVTYTTVMSSLSRLEKFEEALQVADRMRAAGCKPDTLFYNCLIHTLGQARRRTEAVRVFEKEMAKNGVFPNVSTYNTMIAMFCRHKLEDKAFKILEEMEKSKHCRPDVMTYYPLLKLCFRTGNLDNWLRKLLDAMVNKHHLSLDVSTYTLLIHGLCRAKQIKWAYLLFQEMIDRDITPRYKTCCLLLNEIKEKDMHEAAQIIEEFMKNF